VISASGVDLNEMSYFDYASRIYGDKYSLLLSAWEHSLTVNPEEISKAQYPNGETGWCHYSTRCNKHWRLFIWLWYSNNQPLVIPNSVTI